METQIKTLIDARTTVGAGTPVAVSGDNRNYQLKVEGTGLVSATATVYGSLFENGPWEPMITFSASGTGTASDAGETYRKWRYTYANLSAISGTNAKATLNMEV